MASSMFCTAKKVLGPTEQPRSATFMVFEGEKFRMSRFSTIASVTCFLAEFATPLYKIDRGSDTTLFANCL